MQATGTKEKVRKPDVLPLNPSTAKRRRARLSNHKLFELAFNSTQDGAVIVDHEGFILHLNEAYGKSLGVIPKEIIGHHCTEIIENTRLHIVAKTGKPEINFRQRIRNRDVIVQRFPLFTKDKLVGVYARIIFDDINEIKQLHDKFAVLESKVDLYEKELINLRSTRYTIDSIVGVSKAIAELKIDALQASANDFPVLITGESGTGKELFAQAIHHASPRKIFPLVRINCAAIPADLMESELFGYAKGAFTGASNEGKPGKFELADKGSIFLDEIGELPLSMQPKLLRVLEEKEFERVGGTKLYRSDFRLIAATSRNLEEMMAKGTFRRDLFYRLNVIPITIPPLRERRDDIPSLTEHLLQQMSPHVKISKSAREILENAYWQGNTRELINVIERSLSRIKNNIIEVSDLPYHLQHSHQQGTRSCVSTLKQAQESAEKIVIRSALIKSDYNKTKAAKMLRVHRTLLYKKAAKYNIPLDPES